MNTEPLTQIVRLAHFDNARDVGFSPARAARWGAYQSMKHVKGETPITLAEAVRQVEAAKR